MNKTKQHGFSVLGALITMAFVCAIVMALYFLISHIIGENKVDKTEKLIDRVYHLADKYYQENGMLPTNKTILPYFSKDIIYNYKGHQIIATPWYTKENPSFILLRSPDNDKGAFEIFIKNIPYKDCPELITLFQKEIESKKYPISIKGFGGYIFNTSDSYANCLPDSSNANYLILEVFK